MSYGLKKKISKLDLKMGYFGGPNKALENMDLKTKRLVSWRRGANREGEKEMRRGRRIGEEKGGIKSKKVWNFGFCMDHMEL